MVIASLVNVAFFGFLELVFPIGEDGCLGLGEDDVFFLLGRVGVVIGVAGVAIILNVGSAKVLIERQS
tara:strand:+ start:1899 stop:2102 length:204 start_codon:yes stop_codon:yes gene_type:complete